MGWLKLLGATANHTALFLVNSIEGLTLLPSLWFNTSSLLCACVMCSSLHLCPPSLLKSLTAQRHQKPGGCQYRSAESRLYTHAYKSLTPDAIFLDWTGIVWSNALWGKRKCGESLSGASLYDFEIIFFHKYFLMNFQGYPFKSCTGNGEVLCGWISHENVSDLNINCDARGRASWGNSFKCTRSKISPVTELERWEEMKKKFKCQCNLIRTW